MSVATTIGHLLLNEVLPATHQIHSQVDKKKLNAMMVDLARQDPHLYVETIGKLKRVGDAVTTDEGITVGLDDIEPDYVARDKILEPALALVKRTKDPAKRIKLIQDTQQLLAEHTKSHPGQMTPMATSGSRGKINELMRTVTSPVAAVNDKEETIPWMISKSYAEGLKPADNWIALQEARRNSVESFTSVAEPGEVNKDLVNNMSDQIIKAKLLPLPTQRCGLACAQNILPLALVHESLKIDPVELTIAKHHDPSPRRNQLAHFAHQFYVDSFGEVAFSFFGHRPRNGQCPLFA